MNNALNSLPSEWQDWIAGNLERSCDPSSMVDVMVREGRFERSHAAAAVEEAQRGRTAGLEMPDIDTSANSIRTSDRVVEVLLTLRAPRVVLLGNAVSHEECDALADYCTPRLVRSPVVDDVDGTMQMHNSRTSSGVMLQRGETPLVARVESRLAELARWPLERGEGLQIQNYEATNEYRPHFDWFDPELPGPRKHMEHGGQRLATFVLYLTDVESGGGTVFPAFGLEALPRKGNVIFFHNTDASHAGDRRTLHAGAPVVRGVKTIANKWLRERRY